MNKQKEIEATATSVTAVKEAVTDRIKEIFSWLYNNLTLTNDNVKELAERYGIDLEEQR